jgi:hypothetical protein
MGRNRARDGVQFFESDVEARIVGQNRADAGQECIGAGTPAVAVASCRRAGDPLRFTVRTHGPTVNRAASLARTKGRPRSIRERKPALSSRADAAIRPCAVAMPASRIRSSPVLETRGIRIDDRRHDPGHTRLDQGVGAGRCPAVMTAGFEGDVGGGASSRCAGIAQGVDFGVRFAGAFVPTAPDDPAAIWPAHSRRAGWGGWCTGRVRPVAAPRPSSRGRRR